MSAGSVQPSSFLSSELNFEGQHKSGRAIVQDQLEDLLFSPSCCRLYCK